MVTSSPRRAGNTTLESADDLAEPLRSRLRSCNSLLRTYMSHAFERRRHVTPIPPSLPPPKSVPFLSVEELVVVTAAFTYATSSQLSAPSQLSSELASSVVSIVSDKRHWLDVRRCQFSRAQTETRLRDHWLKNRHKTTPRSFTR